MGFPEICSRRGNGHPVQVRPSSRALLQLRRSKDAPLCSRRTRGTACLPPGDPRSQSLFFQHLERLTNSELRPVRAARGKTSSLEEQSLEVSAPPFPWVRPRGIVGRRRPLQGRSVVQATCGIYTYKKEQVAFVFKKLSKPTLPKTSLHILLLSTLSRHEVLSTQCVLHWWAHLCVHVPRRLGLRLPAVLMAPSPRLVLCTSLGSAQGQQRWGHRSPRAWEGKSTTSP